MANALKYIAGIFAASYLIVNGHWLFAMLILLISIVINVKFKK